MSGLTSNTESLPAAYATAEELRMPSHYVTAEFDTLRAAREMAVMKLDPGNYDYIQLYLQDVDTLAHFIETGVIQDNAE